jgi:hypothetical protein
MGLRAKTIKVSCHEFENAINMDVLIVATFRIMTPMTPVVILWIWKASSASLVEMAPGVLDGLS